MAIFEFLITTGRPDASIHKKSGLLVDKHCTDVHFSNHVFGEIAVSYLFRKGKHNYFYEDDDFLMLLRGTLVPDMQGFLPDFKVVAGKIIEEGDQIINDLRGHFNIIQINKSSKQIRIINDYFGLKPVYYGSLNSTAIISSSLALIKKFNPAISKYGIVEKLLFEHNLLNNTIFENIFTLDCATILNQADNSFSSEVYHNWYSFIAEADSGKKFSFREYNEVFCNKIKQIADHDNNNLITLTGGHDGRAVLSAFIKQDLPFETFSFGRPGSENTSIPELVAHKLSFSHKSIYLENEFERDYLNNALRTTQLSEGELMFTQQNTLFSVDKLDQTKILLFTGLLAGEVSGPVHLKKDYINNIYFNFILEHNLLTIDHIKEKVGDFLKFSEEEYSDLHISILKNVEDHKKGLSIVKASNNKHMVYLADMITWGFRKFYAYQIHLIRYHFENIPVFYDFDLVNLLINSTYNKAYKNSYKSLFRRRNSRLLQLRLIITNAKTLSTVKLDRGYTPREALCFLCTPLKILKYILRKRKIKAGKYVPDFLDKDWPFLILKPESYYTTLIDSLPEYIKKDAIISSLRNAKSNNIHLTKEQILTLTLMLFLQNKI